MSLLQSLHLLDILCQLSTKTTKYANYKAVWFTIQPKLIKLCRNRRNYSHIHIVVHIKIRNCENAPRKTLEFEQNYT